MHQPLDASGKPRNHGELVCEYQTSEQCKDSPWEYELHPGVEVTMWRKGTR